MLPKVPRLHLTHSYTMSESQPIVVPSRSPSPIPVPAPVHRPALAGEALPDYDAVTRPTLIEAMMHYQTLDYDRVTLNEAGSFVQSHSIIIESLVMHHSLDERRTRN